jgi:hypothetical protein
LELENTAEAQPQLLGLDHLGSEMTQLTQLHVGACVIGPDSGVQFIARLKSLHLVNCILMTVPNSIATLSLQHNFDSFTMCSTGM